MKRNYTLLVLLFTMSLSFGQTITQVWASPFSMPDKMGRTASPAIASDGTIYIGCSLTTRTSVTPPTLPAPNFFAINPDGTKKWETSINEAPTAVAPATTKPDDILSSPSLNADGSIFMGGQFTKNIFKHNGADGSRIALKGVSGRQRYTAPAFSSDGNSVYVCAYISGGTGGVLSLSSDLATQNWVFEPTISFNSTPAVGADGTIYAASTNGTMYAINPLDGSQKWAKVYGNYVSSGIAIGSDGTVYLSAKLNANVPPDGVLKAYNPADGTEKWSVTITGFNAEQGGPAIAADGTIYLGSSNTTTLTGTMKAFNPANGAEIWSFDTLGGVEVVPAIDNLGRLYFGTTTGNFYVINSDKTAAYTMLDLGDSITSSAAIDKDGSIYVGATLGTGANSGKLYKLQTTATGLQTGGWPMYGGNLRHTSNAQDIYLSTVDNNTIDGFSVYPNPVKNGEFSISTQSNGVKSVQIFDVLGKQVYSKKIEANEKVKTSNLTAGMYILSVEESGKTATRKLIIE